MEMWRLIIAAASAAFVGAGVACTIGGFIMKSMLNKAKLNAIKIVDDKVKAVNDDVDKLETKVDSKTEMIADQHFEFAELRGAINKDTENIKERIKSLEEWRNAK